MNFNIEKYKINNDVVQTITLLYHNKQYLFKSRTIWEWWCYSYHQLQSRLYNIHNLKHIIHLNGLYASFRFENICGFSTFELSPWTFHTEFRFQIYIHSFIDTEWVSRILSSKTFVYFVMFVHSKDVKFTITPYRK